MKKGNLTAFIGGAILLKLIDTIFHLNFVEDCGAYCWGAVMFYITVRLANKIRR